MFDLRYKYKIYIKDGTASSNIKETKYGEHIEWGETPIYSVDNETDAKFLVETYPFLGGSAAEYSAYIENKYLKHSRITKKIEIEVQKKSFLNLNPDIYDKLREAIDAIGIDISDLVENMDNDDGMSCLMNIRILNRARNYPLDLNKRKEILQNDLIFKK